MNVQNTLRKLVASVSALTIVLSTAIIPGMGVNRTQAVGSDEQMIVDAVNEGSGLDLSAGRSLTRYEAAALLAGTDQCDNDVDSGLTGVDDAHMGAVNCVVASGYFHGTSKGTFEGTRTIHRDEFAAVDARFAGIADLTDKTEIDSVLAVYSDAAKIDPGLRGAVAAATQAGLYKGYANTNASATSFFVPQAYAIAPRYVDPGADILTQHAMAAIMIAILVALGGYQASDVLAMTATEKTDNFRTLLDLTVVVVPPASGMLSAILSLKTAPATVLAVGTNYADVGDFDLSGSGDVNAFVFNTNGIFPVTDILAAYIFYNGVRWSNGIVPTTNGVMNFSNLTKIPLPATIKLVISVAPTAISGDQMGFRLISGTLVGGSPVVFSPTPTTPFYGTAVATLATIGFTAPSVPGSVNAGPGEVTLWTSNLNVTVRKVLLKDITLEHTGSAGLGAIINFRLLINGVEAAKTDGLVAGANGASLLIFHIAGTSGTGMELQTGAAVLTIVGIVVAGASRTLSLVLQNAVDVNAIDGQNGASAALSIATVIPLAAAIVTLINTGTCIVTNRPLSTTILTNTSNLLVFVATLVCYGEDVQFRNLSYTAVNGAAPLAVYPNGYFSAGPLADQTKPFSIASNPGQLASQTMPSMLAAANRGIDMQQIGGNTVGGAAAVAVTMSFTATGGVAYELQFHLDTTSVLNAIGNAFTFTLTVPVPPLNAQGLTSRVTSTVPAGAVTGNVATFVNSAIIGMIGDPTYAASTYISPQTGVTGGQWLLTGGSSEDTNVTTWTLTITGTGAVVPGMFSNIVLWYDGVAVGSPVALGTVAPMVFSSFSNLPANATKTAKVTFNILAGPLATNTYFLTLIAGGTTKTSSVTATSPAVVSATGTFVVATLAATAASTASPSGYQRQNTNVIVTSANVQATGDSALLNNAVITFGFVPTTANEVCLLVASVSVRCSAPAATVTMLNINAGNFPKLQIVKVEVQIKFGNISPTAGTDGEILTATLAVGTNATNSNGLIIVPVGLPLAGNTQQAVQDYPVITVLANPSSAYATGTRTVMRLKFTPAGGSSSELLQQFTIAFNKTAGAGTAAIYGSFTIVRESDNSTLPCTCTVTGGGDASAAGTLVASLTTPESILTAGTVLAVKVVITGVVSTGHNATFTMAPGLAALALPATVVTVAGTTATVIWSTGVSGAGPVTVLTLSWLSDQTPMIPNGANTSTLSN